MRLFHLVTALLLAMSLVTPCVAEQRVVVFGNGAKPPKSWNDNGVPKGILIDILREIEKRTDLVFDIKMYPWARAYQYANAGKGGLIGFSKTNERLKHFDYSEVMFFDDILLVTLKGNEFPFQSIDDLKGKTIGVTRGSKYGDEYANAVETIFTPVFDTDPVVRLRMLLAGRVETAIIGPGKAGLEYYLAKDQYLRPHAERFVCLDKPLVRDANFIGFRKELKQGNTIAKINAALNTMWEDGTIERIQNKYVSYSY